MSEPIRLFVVDDHALFREGLARLLAAEPDFQVVGKAGSVQEAVTTVTAARPDVLILDVDLGGARARDLLSAIRGSFEGRVLVVTAGASEQEAVQLVQEGVAGILHKNRPPEQLCNAIRKVAAGDVHLEPAYLRPLFSTVDSSREPAGRARLTPREVVILRHLFQGLANKEIGQQMSLSESTVKAALRVLFEKLGVRTRSQAVRVAIEQYRDQL